jgi:4-hydroxy-tetrahydrodipicolinate synthase
MDLREEFCELAGVRLGECRAPLGPLTVEDKTVFRAALEPIVNGA